MDFFRSGSEDPLNRLDLTGMNRQLTVVTHNLRRFGLYVQPIYVFQVHVNCVNGLQADCPGMKEDLTAGVKDFVTFGCAGRADVACQIFRAENERIQTWITFGNLTQIDDTPRGFDDG